MTEAEWLTGEDPVRMLEAVRHSGSDRKFRLIVCELMRRDPTTKKTDAQKSIVMGERLADGEVTAEQVDAFSIETLPDPDAEEWTTLATLAFTSLEIVVGSERDSSKLKSQLPALL